MNPVAHVLFIHFMENFASIQLFLNGNHLFLHPVNLSVCIPSTNHDHRRNGAVREVEAPSKEEQWSSSNA
eukprot:691938-Pelagomonas_calceolata.AAC.1